MACGSQRDYYKHLFSQDSDDTFLSLSNNEEDKFDLPAFGIPCSNQRNQHTDFSSHPLDNSQEIENLLEELHNQFELDDISLESEFDENQFDLEFDPNITELHPPTTDTLDDSKSSSTASSLEFLGETELIRLLQDDSEDVIRAKSKQYTESTHNHNKYMRYQMDPSDTSHEDRIGSFNIQNQYDHTLAAKLFLEGDFTFLSLQEPFSSNTSIQDAWGACRRYELNSARITCFETHHQVIMFDSWRWGGKIIDNFNNIMDGRLVSVAFGFGKKQSFGFISLYGFARGNINQDDLARKNDLRKTLIYAVRKIQRQWKTKFPNITIIILGDMQETLSISDFDNIGKCRYTNSDSYSIINELHPSYTSVVRDRIPLGEKYLTRFGSEGARGIDHILLPSHEYAQSLIKSAAIDNGLGSLYFPSDHKLIHCSLLRHGPNNAEYGESITQFVFRDIYQMKLKRSGEKGRDLMFDTTQFKLCERYRKHEELFHKVQDLTGDKSTATCFHLNSIEKSIKRLYKSLWETGRIQKVDGKLNKLVEIDERQAAELAAITNAFDTGIKDTMSFLELSHERDNLASMASTRKNITKRSSFKLFDNLPIPTKLRYFRGWIKEKNRHIKRYLKGIQEFRLRVKLGETAKDQSQMLKFWRSTLLSDNLLKKGKLIHLLLNQELEEQEAHMEAIQTKSHKKTTNAAVHQSNKMTQNGNELKYITDSSVALINHWLMESDCNQCFNTRLNRDKFENIISDLGGWSDPIKEIIPDRIQWDNPIEVQSLFEKLQDTSLNLRKIENRIGNTQKAYKIRTLEYLLQVNQIEAFTRKVLPKGREAPATHTEIWDDNLGSFRTCKSDKEELAATGQHHGTWMGNSSASEICAFAKLDNRGLLGNRGIRLNPNRKVTLADVPKLIHNGDTLSRRDRQRFVEAHGKHTAELFQPPSSDHEELHYPFFLLSDSGEMEGDDDFAEMFWKSISSIPGKARYDGFQMAVVGRFGKRWQNCLLHISKLILIMRFIPKRLKAIARFPIPKSGKVNEYRPISLCHDIYCFVNSVSTKYSSEGIMKAGILHDGIAAYVKGKGCSMLVGVEQGLREDCVESGIPTSQTDEDEEKFFDRIPVEILLAAMRVNGFPIQGFLELKASGMGAKTVEIITAKGVAHARFVCGLEQGNPDSPTVANLVIKFKHDIWRNILKEMSNNNRSFQSSSDGKSKGLHFLNKDAYKFHICDEADGTVRIDRIGYCDDNTRYTSSHDEQEVIAITKRYIKRAGDLSLVTKIGRKGSKSEVQYYNLSAQTALKIKPIDSFAWSFTLDRPVSEKVPFKIQLQESELRKAFQLKGFQDLPEEEKTAFLKIFKPKAHKHLGLTSTLAGNSELASQEVIHKAKTRINTLKLWNMEHGAQKICANMLCSTIHSYAPLQMGHSKKDLFDCDKLLLKSVSKRKGLSSSDAKHCIFLDERNGGFGFKSFLEVDIFANARELEIALNGFMLDSEVIRARAAAFLIRHDRPGEDIFHNFTGDAITKLAQYGIHVRDSKDGLVNFILSYYNKQKTYSSVGHCNYKDTDTFSIGLGKEINERIAFGSPLHSLLKRAFDENGTVKQKLVIPADMQPKLSRNTLSSLAKQFKMKQFSEVASGYNFWEWQNTSFYDWTPEQDIPTDPNEWTFINIKDKLMNKYPLSFWKMTMKELKHAAASLINVSHRYKHILDLLRHSQFPPFVATDGSHNEAVNGREARTTGAAVLCLPDLRKSESIQSIDWTQRKAIPVLARIARCPLTFGVHRADIAHGEGLATCLGLEMLSDLPKIMVTDSSSVRDIAIALRERNGNSNCDRKYIRTIISGIGKHICSRMEDTIHLKTGTFSEEALFDMRSKMETCLDISEKWISRSILGETEDKSTKGWNSKYFDRHQDTTFFKVDSHQLDDNGTRIRKDKRYPKLTPNLFLLSTNHFADVGAGLAAKDSFSHIQEARSLQLPPSSLRFFFTWNGDGIDRHVSDFLNSKFQAEKLSHIIKKNTQGLPWRMIPESTMKWSELIRSGGLFRTLKGLSRTHTRSLYKSQVYRKGWIERLKDQGKFRDHGKLQSNSQCIDLLSPCLWCENSHGAKGNRLHAHLFCGHKKLKGFRDNMTRLLEQHLKAFIDLIQNTQNKFVVSLFLQDIEATLEKLHNFSDSNPRSHIKYRNRKDWMEEEDVATWRELLSSTSPVISAIFGFTPVSEIGMPEDAKLNQANCIPLGIIPKKLEDCIWRVGRNYARNTASTEDGQALIQRYMDAWDKIKEINLARAIGLHRITSGVSKEYEDLHRKQYNIEDGSIRVLKKNLLPKPAQTSKPSSNLRKRKTCLTQNTSIILATKKQKTSGKKVRFNISDIPSKTCIGVTCDKSYHNWNMGDFAPNTIEGQRKHCHRCSKQCTAIRKAALLLRECSNSLNTVENQAMVKHMDDINQQPKYTQTKRKLETVIASELTKGQRNKKTCTDTEKLLLNTMTECITKHTDITDSAQNRADIAARKLGQLDGTISDFLKNDLKAYTKIRRGIASERSYNQKNIKIQGKGIKIRTNGLTETIWGSNEFQRNQHSSRFQTEGYNQLIGGDALKLAIMNIRTKAPSHTYCANAAAAKVIQTCKDNTDWRKFASCFGTKEAMQKPHGVYLIPIFEGESRGGHWFLIVIEKTKEFCRGWVLDSLGTGATSGDSAKTIKRLFSRARMACTWTAVQSVRQQENECGARTLFGMVSICDELKEGRTMDQAIKKATMKDIEFGTYDPRQLRRQVAALMRVSDITRMKYEADIGEMRRWWKRIRSRERGRSGPGYEGTEVIDLC